MNLRGEHPGKPEKHPRTGFQSQETGRSGEGGPRVLYKTKVTIPCKDSPSARSLKMAITKRLRFAFYVLVTLEVLLLSSYYSWGRVRMHNPETDMRLSDTTPTVDGTESP